MIGGFRLSIRMLKIVDKYKDAEDLGKKLGGNGFADRAIV